ncbi:LLM class flavin-dependent oxidoreductase [Streptomyces sp. 769]|uniref:LLM class flavin-dependent oxidoreductase n=1 Tax=Streptomyces sp. 769 TaxID=1262452 RepID=UPI00058229F8|nr:LLM class flavin-dependent oxidoreductase [Streptomyces sp. 769]AJC62150.1 putative oxidoreductase [Streptomyces sp. 769]
MKFGISFFPSVGPEDKSGQEYYREALEIVELAESLGYDHVRAVEHYFFSYGGYSPDPVTFLAAAAARTTKLRITTSAVVPAFTHPVKLAGKLAMLDNIADGRLDIGFARAFLPDEFAAFGVSMDESRARFEEGINACLRLWTEENVTWEGEFYRFGPVTLLPRMVQRPHPPIFVATAGSLESCEAAGRAGHNLQTVLAVSNRDQVCDMMSTYRQARAAAGHRPGTEQIQVSLPLFLAEDAEEARALGRYDDAKNRANMGRAVSAWRTTQSSQYSGYDKLADSIAGLDFDQRVHDNKILAGSPDDVRGQLEDIAQWFGDDLTVCLITHSGNLGLDKTQRTLRLFADEVLPKLSFDVTVR